MSDDLKKRENLQSKRQNRGKGAEPETEQGAKQGTGRETIKPASSREVSPNTPSGEEA